jgi:CheY-like chemotaxis protein
MAQILVIDDEDQVRRLIREVLEAAGHEITEAPNGRVGVRLFRQSPARLVITNIFMPEQEGIETITELRNDYPDLPILAISGGGSSGGTDVLETAEAFGASAILAKPFDLPALTGAVEKLLAQTV